LKRVVFSGLIVLMLCLMVFPIPLRADDSTATATLKPYEWLNDAEKAYVDKVRATTATALSQVDSVKNILGTATPEMDWFNNLYLPAVNSLVSTVGAFDYLGAPPEFQKVAWAYGELNSYMFSISEADWSNLSKAKAKGLMDMIILVAPADAAMDSMKAKLNSQSAAIEAQIADIAKRREAAAKMVSSLFASCSNETS